MLCILIYRPPKQPTNFISEFSELLTLTLPNYDRVLILGDFNIHVCCPTHPLVKEFSTVIEQFNLTQSITSPTHVKNHTLDLVLSSGLSPSNLELIDICISDHKAIMFDSLLTPSAPTQLFSSDSRILTSSTSTQFSAAFRAAPTTCQLESPFLSLNTEELLSLFNQSCNQILNSVAPLKN